MKFLFFGAGVLGSLYAAKLHEAGEDVTLLARGSRYEELQEHGVVLEEFTSKEQTATPVRLVDRMPEEEHFDVCGAGAENPAAGRTAGTAEESPHPVVSLHAQ